MIKKKNSEKKKQTNKEASLNAMKKKILNWQISMREGCTSVGEWQW